ncbi:hypothetical protein MSAN_01310700 [Mycena sanguinolenta]|uniref:F-box domain-containing protein n=1 Tax=Mycena sanguinolenta TaxID=230812 RepID=A0A8H7D306_9AGAR|nr:hypothetical protein MSAN_01310700 [Mycena sanguinolenta]
MLFYDLDEDILAEILLLCDVYAVVSFSRVNKSFRRLALSKQLWISLIRDLSCQYFIPQLEALDNCTITQLIAKVKCLVCGPETWSQRSSVPPTVSFAKKFPAETHARILPGGRYFTVMRFSGHLYCCDVLTGRDVYIRALGSTNFVWWSWETEMLDDGHTAIFSFLVYVRSGNGPHAELSILQVDLRTGHSEQLFSLTPSKFGGFYHNPIISGNFLAMSLSRQEERMIIIINWRERKYVVFDTGHTYTPAKEYMVLVSGHIILATAALEPPNDRLLSVYTLHSIASHWRPVEELLRNTDLPAHGIRIHPNDISPILVERMEHNNRVFRGSSSRGAHIRMMLHANPIRPNAYKLMVYASVMAAGRSLVDTFRQSFRDRSAQGTVLFNYAINLSASNHGFSWSRISSFSVLPDAFYYLPSYAGYVAISCSNSDGSTTTKIVDPRLTQRWVGHAMREVMVVSTEPVWATLSYNGVLLVSKQDGIEVSCYT